MGDTPKKDFTPAPTAMDAFQEAMETGQEVDYLEVVPQFTPGEAYIFGRHCDSCNFDLTKGPHVCFGIVLADDGEDDDDED